MLDQLVHFGFLYSIESLLSTHGKEVGMLEDMSFVITRLSQVQIFLVEECKVHQDDPATTHPSPAMMPKAPKTPKRSGGSQNLYEFRQGVVFGLTHPLPSHSLGVV